MQDIANQYIYLVGFDEQEKRKVDVATVMLHSKLIHQMFNQKSSWTPGSSLYVPATRQELDDVCRRLVGQDKVDLSQHLVDYLGIGELQEEAKLHKEQLLLAADRDRFEQDVQRIEKDWELFVRNDVITKRIFAGDYILNCYHHQKLYQTRFKEHFTSKAKQVGGTVDFQDVVSDHDDKKGEIKLLYVRVFFPYHLVSKLREAERDKQVQQDAKLLADEITKRQHEESLPKRPSLRRTIRFRPRKFITFDVLKATEALLNDYNPTKSHSYHLHIIHNELIVRYSPTLVPES